MKANTPYFLFTLLVFLISCQPTVPEIDFESLSEEDQHLAENAVASMELAEGLQATLFVSEPTMINPTNIDVDENGRVWVIEALNYRNRYNPNNPYREEGDRILILEDTNGDGKADKTKVYYQGEDINSALGICKLGNKLIVASSPNIFLFTDTDGDDKPDDKQIIFTNIKGWDHDHGAHAFIFGPDGRLYFNMGNEGIQLQRPDNRTVVDVNGKAVITNGDNFRQGLAMRCDPDMTNVEVIAHNFRNNYELTVDSYGTVWQSDNDDDGNKATRINFVMEYGNYGFTDQVTGAGWRNRRVGMHDEIPKRHWHLNDPGVVPNLLQTGSGSPTGMLFYEGDLLPEVFQQQMIHCEPGHQVVRAYPTKKAGAGYRAEIVNVMKSKDQWFRPSDVCTAPDGSIFVADWYDPGVGGHKMGDVERGRIYRIAPRGEKYKVPAFSLDNPEAAVKALQSPNLSIRYLAWNKLHDWGAEAEPALQQLWSGEAQNMRARALWLLARISGKSTEYLRAAVADSNPDIRITGLRAARQLDKDNLLTYLEVLQNDAAPEVRREVAIALRHFVDEVAGAEIWANLVKQYDGQDRWYLEAMGIAADPHSDIYFHKWLNQAGEDWNDEKGQDIIWRSRSNATAALLVKMIADPKVSEENIKRYFRAFHFQSNSKKNEQIASLVDIEHPLKRQIDAYALGQIEGSYLEQSPALREKVNRILPEIEGTPEWISAIKSLKLRNQNVPLLAMFLTQEDKTLAVEAGQTLLDLGGSRFMEKALHGTRGDDQREFIQRLGWVKSGDKAPKILRTLLDNPANSLPVKRLAVEALGDSWDGQLLLFSLLEKDQLDENLIQTAALKMLYSWNDKVREAAPKYLADTGSDNPLPSLNELAVMEGHMASGKEVFSTYCGTCHQVKGEGINFGPDLSEIGSKLARRAMYSAIIYPSAGINFGYEGFQITLKDGTLYQGFIESETEDEWSIRMMGGISQTLKKEDIASKVEMDKSLMLEGLHKIMGQEKLVDLVAYLSSLKTEELLSSK